MEKGWSLFYNKSMKKKGASAALKKKSIIIGALSALLIAAVCFLPIPHKIEARMYGATTTESGEIIREVKFDVTGWELKYLFRDDRLDIRITFGPDGREPLLGGRGGAKTLGPLHAVFPVYLTTYAAYRTDEQAFVSGFFALTPNCDRCILTGVSTANDFLIGSTNPDFDADEILDFFEGLVP